MTRILPAPVAHAVILLHIAAAMAAAQPSPLSYVDPTIGGSGIVLEPTRPTVQLPRCMVRTFPMRKDQLDDQVSFFPLLLTSHRGASVFALMPVSGSVDEGIWSRRLMNDREVTTPCYYRTSFPEEGITAEVTPAATSGFFRFTFTDRREHYIRIAVINGAGALAVADDHTVTGTEGFSGMHAYCCAEVDAPIGSVVRRAPLDSTALLLSFGREPRAVMLRYGVSFVSGERARLNLRAEISGWKFEAVERHARAAWDSTLSRIGVRGGTESQRRVFYSAFYRCCERMVDINEHGWYYSAYDHAVHRSAEPFFVDNWIWDMYNALEPLWTLLDPALETEKIRSYVAMYRQSGWMPSFALVAGDWPAMTANHAAAWMADAWFKGLRDFDMRTAYEGLRKNSLEATLLPWCNGPATSLDTFYNAHGYMPGLRPGEKETVPAVHDDWEKRQSVSVTLENSYDDWCIAQLAPYAGRPEDRALFLRRAANYRNVYRADRGFMWPKDSTGAWIEPFDPRFAGREYFTENNAYVYNWQVKHDFAGLFALMGGRAKAEAKLDQLYREDLGAPKFRFWYTQPDASGLVGQFVMGNEPAFHIPYLYDYTGAPWKTQKRIRMLLQTWFTDTVLGFPGDEDGGGMSSFVVFSMMGFYPVTPGVPVYAVGSPVFDRVTLRLPGGKTFTIVAKNNSSANKYIQSASLNGRPLLKPWFTHADIARGGTLEFVMGDTPNMSWGAREEDAPPSSLEYSPGH